MKANRVVHAELTTTEVLLVCVWLRYTDPRAKGASSPRKGPCPPSDGIK